MPYINSADTSTVNKQDLEIVQPSVRILHVVGGMIRGGIETWLMHILRHIDRDRFQMDFLVHTDQTCAYDEEIRSFGSRVISCPHLSQPWTYASHLKRILREYGPYDIIHSHVHNFNGYILYIARAAGVPIRIAHSHTDLSSKETRIGLYRYLYLALSKHWITHHATFGIGGSQKTAANLFGANWEKDPRWQILHYGIDLNLLENEIDRSAIRTQLGIPADAFVIGHVGRFVEVKNHGFLVKIAAEVARREPNMRLLLVGDGSLRPDIQQQVIQEGLTDQVIFTGVRSDVAQLMLGAMNTFILPSLYEGLPLVLLEAQAAGLPCLFSDIITKEVEIVKPLVQSLSLSQPASDWAEAILNTKNTGLNITRSEALLLVQQSEFNISTCVKALEKIYLKQLKTYCHSQI
jgi:glycosyltransferase involved in cell wall biosynthesis